MSQESKRTYTIRLPETVAARVEKQAAISGIAPTTLIQSLVVDKCMRFAERAETTPLRLIGKLDALSKACERLEQNAAERYGRLLFEVVKTRSVFLHALDQSLASPSWTKSSKHRRRPHASTSIVSERREVPSNESIRRRAVRCRADLASLQIWAQTALRTVLLIVLLWALLTVALVWYWTGYYGGLAAHQYFGSWILAWFFTQEIPLTFASLPYRGGRYTIASMYDSSTTSITSGVRSPAGSGTTRAGAFITALIVGACS